MPKCRKFGTKTQCFDCDYRRKCFPKRRVKVTQDELVERVADLIHSETTGSYSEALTLARAIIPIVQAVTLDLVESHLSACAYDPAPYTALKYRLAAIRNQEPTDAR